MWNAASPHAAADAIDRCRYLAALIIGTVPLYGVAVNRDEAAQDAALDRIECTLYTENCPEPTTVHGRMRDCPAFQEPSRERGAAQYVAW